MTVDGDQKPARDRVFMDISIGGLPSGRLIFELFNDVAPKTTENFRALCAGDMGIGSSTGKPLTYKGMVFHRVVKDFMIQGGDFTNSNGTGGESIYGGTFEDENFELQHDKPFLLSMANRGKDTNGSQFFITTQPAPHLDNVHVVFGAVVGGAALVRQLEALPVDRNARPLQDVAVANCGQLVKLQPGKKRKGKEIKEESDSEAEKSVKKDEKKKKKKDKKEKKKKRRQSASMEEDEIPEASSHPLVMTSKIDPNEIPDVPTNRFLMRGGRDQDKNDPRKDRERMRYRERDRNSYTRSGRIIKGRGVFRYRTPSRSRSRSRSVTPPHWRMAQRRIIKLSEFERAEQERTELEQQEAAKLPSEVHQNRDDGGTPEQPQEKEEGECDSTIERPRHERIDYNALDFEEDVENDEEEPPFRRVPERAARRRERRRDASPSQSRAEVLARALGVNPNRAKEIIGQHRDTRRGLPSSIQAAPKSVGQGLDFQGHGHGQGLGQGQGLDQGSSSGMGPSDGYDPFSILRSTFRNKEQGQGSAHKNDQPDRFNQERPDRADRHKDKDKADRKGRSRRHSDKDKADQPKVRKEKVKNIDGAKKDAKNQDEDQTEKAEKPQKTLPKQIVSEEVAKEKSRDGNKDEANGKSDHDRAISQDEEKRIDRDKRKDSRDKDDKEKPRERSRSYEKRRERSRSKGGRDDRRRDRSKNRDDNKRVERRRDRSAEKRRDRSRSFEVRRDRSRSRNNRRSRSKSKGQDKRRDRSRSQRRDRSRSHEKRRDRSRSFEKRRDRSRSPEKRRDRSRSKGNDDRRKRSSRSRSRSRSPRNERSKSRNRMPSTSDNPERGREKSPPEDKKEEEDDARKELMEIVRLIKSRQKDRETKAAVKISEAKKYNDLSHSDDSPGEKERRPSTDRDGSNRKRSESPRRTRDLSSSSRRRPRSGSRRDDRERRHSSTSR